MLLDLLALRLILIQIVFELDRNANNFYNVYLLHVLIFCCEKYKYWRVRLLDEELKSINF